MTEAELVAKFNEMGGAAPKRWKVAYQHLFGILFDQAIKDAGTNGARIATLAGTPSVNVEINAGRKLAPYVTVNPGFAGLWK